jgi:serine/threonine-protein kinase RsbW
LSSLFEIDLLLEYVIRHFRVSDVFSGILNLALYESIKNAIVHGNKCDSDKKVVVDVRFERPKLLFSITDEGDGFDYNYFLQQPVEQLGKNGLSLLKILTTNLSFAKNGAQIFYEVDVSFPLFANEERSGISQQLLSVVKNP